ncbi:MAG TPA: hypothetical protein VMU61_01030 [Candidatus Aquilonibacter sp.]|nr:hypothetical protein [Candidatus Aquilonibacter sp.]
MTPREEIKAGKHERIRELLRNIRAIQPVREDDRLMCEAVGFERSEPQQIKKQLTKSTR